MERSAECRRTLRGVMHVMHLHHSGIMVTTQTPPSPLPEMYSSVVQACLLQVYSTCSQRSQIL